MARKRRKPNQTTQNGTVSGTVSSTITAPDKEMRPRITPQITERVKLFAEKHGLPVQAVINLAIVEYLNQFD